VREFHLGRRLVFWLIVVAVVVALFVVFFVSGHGGVSGGSS
jgi:hypothetical protein